MKRILIVAYYFPPLAMGGVQRALKFCKYLPDFGWEPVVLTVKDLVYRAYDPDLLSEIPGVEILRTESLDPLRLIRRLQRRQNSFQTSSGPNRGSILYERITPWLFVPDPKMLWVPFALQAAKEYLRRKPVQAVLTTSPPHSVHLVGYGLQAWFGLPWVADFRDDWMQEAHERPPTRIHAAFNAWIRRQVIGAADRVIAVSPQIAYRLGQDRRPGRERPEVLYNGFDAADFARVGKTWQDRCTITYVGTLNPILPPTPFFRGLSLCVSRRPEIRSKLRIRLVGGHYGFDLEAMIRQGGLEDLVLHEGYRPHREAVRALLDSDLLLLIMSPKLSAGRIPGKLFEYLGSGKPILAVIPESEAARLIQKHGAGWVLHPEDTEGLATTIAEVVHLWERGMLKRPALEPASLDWCERRSQTQRLARILDALVAPELRVAVSSIEGREARC